MSHRETQTDPRKRRRRRLLAIGIPLLLLVLLIGGFLIYVSIYYHADQEAIAAYSADISVEEQVLPDGSLRFGTGREEYGLIFYPGGKVEHEAYKPLMRTLAEKGVFCVVCKMPFRLAVLDRDAADGIRDAYPEIRHWYLGGHSLGGAMAASYLSEHSGDYDGLILLAAYSTADLTGSGCRVLSLYGSEDGVLNRKDYTKNRSNLPADTRETVIPGGCHAFFGMYGPQSGDGTPAITAAEQIRFTAREILDWMRNP